jgi:hypothetical protein
MDVWGVVLFAFAGVKIGSECVKTGSLFGQKKDTKCFFIALLLHGRNDNIYK